MTRRASLPGADELFRRTVDEQQAAPPSRATVLPVKNHAADSEPKEARGSGVVRPKHDEKVTFYCTEEQLTRLERARLTLRAEHRVASDRGRLVRAALDEMLDEFEASGAHSRLLRRLRSTRP